MRCRQAVCPGCGRLLNVPPGCNNRIVRCGSCHSRFRLPKRIAVTDDVIAEWLWESEVPEEGAAAQASVQTATPAATALQSAAATGTAVRAYCDAAVSLTSLSSGGAVFEFPSEMLMDKSFRSALPRECARCGTKSRLKARPVIFAPDLQISREMSLAEAHNAGELTLSAAEVRDLSNAEVLNRMPLVPGVQPPVNLPMPYWLCESCSSGVVTGQVHFDARNARGHCKLRINNLALAAKFLIGVGQRDGNDYRRVIHQIRKQEEDPWTSLPETVRHRIEQWYKPRTGEHFVAYIPDRRRTRNEDGMAGLVITDQRLLSHTALTHHEVPAAQFLDCRLSERDGRRDLRIRTAHWEFAHISVDRDGLSRFHRALHRAQFKAKWH